MACEGTNSPNIICVSYDGTTWTFTPETLDYDRNANSDIQLKRDENDWTFASFDWVPPLPPDGQFGTPDVKNNKITLSDADTATGEWSYKVCINYGGAVVCSDPKIVNM